MDIKKTQVNKLIYLLSNNAPNQLADLFGDFEDLLNTIEYLLNEDNMIEKSLLEKLATLKNNLVQSINQNTEISSIKRINEPQLTLERPQKSIKKEKSVKINDTASAVKIQQLLQDQKDSHLKQLEQEQSTKHVLVEELSELTSALKETTISINKSVRLQNNQLESMQHFAAENEIELDQQKTKLRERTKTATRSIMSSIGMMLWIIALFILTYAVIRLFPKPLSSSSHTCPAPA